MAISTVIIKPTKACNADCSYCSAPPEVNGDGKWDIDRFKRVFDRIQPGLAPWATVIWHGGEPMLMGPDFYVKAWEYAQSAMPGVKFAMQTNLLLYTPRWKHVFHEIMGGQVSTSFDPDERHRQYKGRTDLYTRLFMNRLGMATDDGIHPLVIGTYSEETIDKAFDMYDFCMSWGERAPALRFNYRYPAGRDVESGATLTPETYGRTLLALYDRWIKDVPAFQITPLDQMLKKAVGRESGRCPWSKSCGGQFLEIEPNGDVYNCSEFADLGDEAFSYGNIDAHDLATLMRSPAAAAMRRRQYDLPADCLSCRHFDECEGGCARDSVLFGRGLGGKFFYCQSWKMVFDRIKQTIRNGEADGVMAKYDMDLDAARNRLGGRLVEVA